MKSKLRSGERVLIEESATLVGGLRNVNWLNVGGLIYITNRRLIFEPVGWPFQTDSTTIPLDSIAVVRPRNTLWLIPDSMEIETRAGARYHFKVWSRDRLIDLIEAQMKNPPPAPPLPEAGD
jgi:hypothetical protein